MFFVNKKIVLLLPRRPHVEDGNSSAACSSTTQQCVGTKNTLGVAQCVCRQRWLLRCARARCATVEIETVSRRNLQQNINDFLLLSRGAARNVHA